MFLDVAASRDYLTIRLNTSKYTESSFFQYILFNFQSKTDFPRT